MRYELTIPTHHIITITFGMIKMMAAFRADDLETQAVQSSDKTCAAYGRQLIHTETVIR